MGRIDKLLHEMQERCQRLCVKPGFTKNRSFVAAMGVEPAKYAETFPDGSIYYDALSAGLDALNAVNIWDYIE